MKTTTNISQTNIDKVESFKKGNLYIYDHQENETVVVCCTQDSLEHESGFVGIVIASKNSHKLGEFCDYWSRRYFKPFYGSITINQEP